MLLLDLLNALDDADIVLSLTGATFTAKGPTASLEALGCEIAAHRDLLFAHLVGVETGHVLAFCEVCMAPTMTAAKQPGGGDREKWPTCRDRPGCGGRDQHGTPAARCHPRPSDLAARRDSPAPPTAARQPPKPASARLLGPRPPWPGDPS